MKWIAILLVLCGTVVSFAQPPSQAVIESVELIESGIFTVERVGKPFRARTTASGLAHVARRPVLISATKIIPATVGTTFGFTFLIKGKPHGSRISVTTVVKHPPFTKPDGTKTGTVDKTPGMYLVGETVGCTYTLDHDWESVPGNWSIEAWHGTKKLAERGYLIKKPIDTVAEQSQQVVPPTMISEDSEFWADPSNWPKQIKSETGEYTLFCYEHRYGEANNWIRQGAMKSNGLWTSAEYLDNEKTNNIVTNLPIHAMYYNRYGPSYSWRPDGTILNKRYYKISADFGDHWYYLNGNQAFAAYTSYVSNSYRTVWYETNGQPLAEMKGPLSRMDTDEKQLFFVRGAAVSKDEFDKVTIPMGEIMEELTQGITSHLNSEK